MAWGVVTLATAVLTLVLFGVAAGLLARGWSPRSGRRDATSTGDWLRGLGTELRGGSEDDAQADGVEPAR
jgi:hypothetical protein